MIPSYKEFNEGRQFTTTKGAEMAKLEYDKDEVSKASSNTVVRVPGTWRFTVKDAELREAKSGIKGINITMEVDQDGAFHKTFDTFWMTEKALFRLKDVSVACGKELPDEDTDMIGWQGKAVFSIDDKGYFKVDRYVTTDSEAKKEGENFKKASSSDW